jgi:DNA-binding winged helix-turn-helix (wHTH) protein/TolB-like protein/Flp pilus assembly protein TadD
MLLNVRTERREVVRRELRIGEKILSMPAAEGDSLRCFGPFVLNRTRRRLLRKGVVVALTPKAFDILALLAESGGQVVLKETILETVWPDTVVDEGSLTFQVFTLRKALSDGGADTDRYIVTIPGRGYQLAAPVAQASEKTLNDDPVSPGTAIVDERREHLPRVRIPLIAILTVVAAAILAFAFFRLREKPSGPGSATPTLAVLPFKPLVASARDEALEMGMADTLIAKISGIHGVTVRPLSAVRRYRGLEQDPIQAGRELGVDAVLDGSIHSAANQVRVTVRLLRVSDGSQLWSGQFNSAFSNIFSLHDAISARLVDELAFKLTDADRTRLRRQDTDSPEAYRAYLLGRLHFGRPRREEFLKALAFYQKAVALDPNYALAYAGAADVYGSLPIGCDFRAGPPSQAARVAAVRAIALDPELGGARAALAREKFFFEWDWKGTEDELRRAILLDPSSSEAHRMYGQLLSNTGRHAEALREAEEALRLDPLSVINNAVYGQFLLHAGRVDQSIAALKRGLEVEPTAWIVRLQLGNAFARKGMNAEALAEYQVSYAHSGGATEPLARTAYLLGKTGHESEARQILSELTTISKGRYVPPYNLAVVHTGLGENANALQELRRACVERDARLVFLKVEPLWNALHAELGFADVERCVNLP